MLDRCRYRGALLGSLVGDVLGAPFEGHEGVVTAARLARVLEASSVLSFTDDTASTIAVAESLCVSAGSTRTNWRRTGRRLGRRAGRRLQLPDSRSVALDPRREEMDGSR